MNHIESTTYLTRPNLELKSEYFSFYQEWKESEEEMVPWVIKKEPSDFKGMVQFLLESEKDENLPKKWVPASTFWLLTGNKKVIGAVNIRHRLTDELLRSGGHIGYGIRPSERRKGYATILLALSIEKAKELGIKKVLVTCDDRNIGSKKTILNNGGIPDTDYITEEGKIIKRFWIEK